MALVKIVLVNIYKSALQAATILVTMASEK